MPYKIYSYKGKYRVCKPGGKKCFSKKGLSKAKAEAQRRALYASENIKESLSRSNLKFKLVVSPAQGEKKCTVVYKVLSEAATDLFVVYEVGTTLDSTQCMYFAVVDHNDPHGKLHIEKDIHSKSAERLLETYSLTPDDVETAKSEGMNKIKEHIFDALKTLSLPYEESKSFENFAKHVLAE